jgi:hypothetical protein
MSYEFLVPLPIISVLEVRYGNASQKAIGYLFTAFYSDLMKP